MFLHDYTYWHFVNIKKRRKNNRKINLFLDLWVLIFVLLNLSKNKIHSSCQINSQYFIYKKKKNVHI